MPQPYHYRRLSKLEQDALLAHRKSLARPWHSPPRRIYDSPASFHIIAACYEHRPVIGTSASRLDAFAETVLQTCGDVSAIAYAWCILPNHYHLLLHVPDLPGLLHSLGQLHGRTSRAWNLEDDCPGRQNFHRAVDREIRSESHFWVTTNYIHHNPVRHGYVQRWQEWPWSSAHAYLESVGIAEAERLWREFPVDKYGEGWDDPGL